MRLEWVIARTIAKILGNWTRLKWAPIDSLYSTLNSFCGKHFEEWMRNKAEKTLQYVDEKNAIFETAAGNWRRRGMSEWALTTHLKNNRRYRELNWMEDSFVCLRIEKRWASSPSPDNICGKNMEQNIFVGYLIFCLMRYYTGNGWKGCKQKRLKENYKKHMKENKYCSLSNLSPTAMKLQVRSHTLTIIELFLFTIFSTIDFPLAYEHS